MTIGFVYFAGYDNVVKIGISIKPKQRMSGLNTSSPGVVSLYVKVQTANMEVLEKRLHHHFAEQRLPKKREWFSLNDELTMLINNLQAVQTATEYDVGRFLTMYAQLEAITKYQDVVRQLEQTKRHAALLTCSQQELWAIEYAARSLGMMDFGIFQERYNEAKQHIATLANDEAPIFIRKADGQLTMVAATDETSGIVPTWITLDGETEAA